MPDKKLSDGERYLAEHRELSPRSGGQWGAVDTYIEEELLADADPIFEQVLRANAAGGLPPIDVSAPQGKFLNLMVQVTSARRILEIGTLGGYSTIWMAKALPAGGRVVTLEYSPKHAEVARENFARASVLGRVEVKVGLAIVTLPTLAETYDLIFIDADKPNNRNYLEWALKLSHPGTVIILDNVVRDGRVVDPRSEDRNVKGSREAFAYLKGHPRIDSTALQTVGAKGWDGFIMGVVKAA